MANPAPQTRHRPAPCSSSGPCRCARRRRAPLSGTPLRLPRLQKGHHLSNYLLRLYVTGKTPRAEKAIANLRRICEDDLQGRYELQIIDVLQDPQLAEDEKILATPTLIKRLPPPLRRVIGDLSDREKVLLGLEVWPDLPPADDDPEPDPDVDPDPAAERGDR
jgi:circadian clock protein KaiB